MSTLTFIGKSQTRKRNSGYDLWIEAGNTGTEQDYELALHGYTSSQVRLLKRYNSTPTTTYKTEGGSNVTYTFETNGVTFAGSDAGWSATPPSGTGDLYAIYATALSKGTTDLIEPDEWTAPALLSTEGSPGQPGRNVTTVFVFKSSPTQPEEPTGVITYNFVDGTVSGLSGGWSKTDTSGDKVWISSATASSIDTTVTLTGWSTPTVWKQKGDTGVGLTQPTEEYAVNNDSTNPPQSGWTTFSAASAQLDETNRFLWNKETMNYSDGTSSQNPSYHIVYRYTIDGTNAKNIKGIDEWYAYGSISAPDSSTWDNTAPKTPSSTNQYVWQRERVIFEDSTYGDFATAHLIAMWIKGADGVSVTDIVDEYAVNNNDSSAPSSGWDSFDNVKSQLGPTNRFLWNRETVYYDGVADTPLNAHIIYRVSTDGSNAKNITSVNEYSAYGSDSAPISPASKTDPDWSTNWGLTPKVPDATAGHHYVWQCEELVFDDNTTSALTTARRVAQYVEDGKDADVFDFTVSSQTYAKNLRVVGTNSIKVTVSLQGQYSSSTVTVKHDNTNLSYITKKNGTVVTPTYSISVTDTDTLEVSIPMDVSFPVTIGMGSLEKVINCVDETEYGHNYGLLSTAPTVSSTPRLIFEACKERDYYTSTADGNTYEYVGNSEWIESESTPKLLNGLTDILNDTTYDLNNYQDANNVSLFRRILVQEVIASVIKSINLEVGNKDIPSGEDSAFYVNIGENNGNPTFLVRYKYKVGNDVRSRDVLSINASSGIVSMINASLTGDDSSFQSSSFATSKASDTQTTVSAQLNALTRYYVLESVSYDSMSLAKAIFDFACSVGTPIKLHSSTYYNGYRANYSGYYGGEAFSYIEVCTDVPRTINTQYYGVISSGRLYIEITDAYSERILPISTQSYVTNGSIDCTDEDFDRGYLVTQSFLSGIINGTFSGGVSIPSNTTMTIKSGGSITVGSTTITASDSVNAYFTVSTSNFSSTDSLNNSINVSVGDFIDAMNLSFTLETSMNGIKTKNVVPFDSSEIYKIGTSANPFEFHGNVNGDASSSDGSSHKVWGAVFN